MDDVTWGESGLDRVHVPTGTKWYYTIKYNMSVYPTWRHESGAEIWRDGQGDWRIDVKPYAESAKFGSEAEAMVASLMAASGTVPNTTRGTRQEIFAMIRDFARSVRAESAKTLVVHRKKVKGFSRVNQLMVSRSDGVESQLAIYSLSKSGYPVHLVLPGSDVIPGSSDVMCHDKISLEMVLADLKSEALILVYP